jgi:hypothetical protein
MPYTYFCIILELYKSPFQSPECQDGNEHHKQGQLPSDSQACESKEEVRSKREDGSVGKHKDGSNCEHEDNSIGEREDGSIGKHEDSALTSTRTTASASTRTTEREDGNAGELRAHQGETKRKLTRHAGHKEL